MKSKLTDVRALMDDSVYKDEMFTDKHKRQVLNRLSKKQRNQNWVPRSLSVVFSLILVVSVIYLFNNVLNGMDGAPVQQGNPDGAEQPPTPPQEPAESPVPDVPDESEQEEENDETSDEEEKNEIADDGVFELTPEELAAYENFSADFDTAHLKDLAPLSVAKLYIWAGYNQNYEVEYELYTDREESVMWSKEEHMDMAQDDFNSTPQEVLALFNNIEDGEFIQSDEYYGYIRYYPTEDKNLEATSGFVLLQNEDGVWQVGFMPLQ